MSLIDDLRKEAQDLKDGTAVSEMAKTARRAVVAERQRGPMRGIDRYFTELAEHLQIVKPRIAVDYRIEGFPRLSGLHQGDYKAAADTPGDAKGFSFSCACTGRGRYHARVQNPALAEQRRRELRHQGLRFRETPVGRGVTLFALEPWIPVSITFQAETDRDCIVLTLRNLPHLGVVTHHCQTADIDDIFLEELAKLILRRPNRFDQLTGSVVPAVERQQLRATLAWEQRRRAAELKGGVRKLMFNLTERLRGRSPRA